MTVTAEVKDVTGQLADLVKQVQAGNDVLLVEGNKPVARLVPATENGKPPIAIRIRSLKGHQVLTPNISQAELSAEMFNRE